MAKFVSIACFVNYYTWSVFVRGTMSKKDIQALYKQHVVFSRACVYAIYQTGADLVYSNIDPDRSKIRQDQNNYAGMRQIIALLL